MKNVILIGMPAVGKSTVGRALALQLKKDFVDTDDAIKQSCMLPLSEILNKYGMENFIKIEERVISSLNLTNTVIATGGSAVYGEKAMQKLKENGIVVYLKISYENIVLRWRKINSRGVVMKEGMTLRQLYDERCALYEKYADVIIEEDGKKAEETVKDCLKAISLTN